MIDRIKNIDQTRSLTCELWDVLCDEFEENCPHYNGTVLYSENHKYPHLISLVKKIPCIFMIIYWHMLFTHLHPTRNYLLQWRHKEPDGVSNHQRLNCLLNRLFRHRSKKSSKLRVTVLCVRGIHRWPANSPHTGPVTWKMFPFENVIMSAGDDPWEIRNQPCWASGYKYHQFPK